MPPSTDDFRNALTEVFRSAEHLGLVAVDITAGNLHRRVGGYPGADHRMAACCNAMRDMMGSEDEIVAEPPARDGASVRIRYQLPRAR